MLRVTLKANPFRPAETVHLVHEGRSIDGLLDDLLPDHAHRMIVVLIDDDLVPPERWRHVRPRPGCPLTVIAVPQGGGGGGRSFLLLAISMASLFLAPALGGALAAGLGVTSASGIAAIKSAVAVGFSLVGLLAAALIPVKEPEEQEDESYGISKFRNALEPWGTPPYVCGKLRVFPKKAAQAVIENNGNYQQLRELFDFGPGPLLLTDFKIGDTPLDQYSDLDVTWTESYDTGNNGDDTVWVDAFDGTPGEIHYYGDNYTLDVSVELVAPNFNDQQAPSDTFDFLDDPINVGNPNLAGDLTPGGDYSRLFTPTQGGAYSWVNRIVSNTTTRADEIVLNFTYPQGLYTTNSDGEIEGRHSAIRIFIVNADVLHPDHNFVYYDESVDLSLKFQTTYYYALRLPMAAVAPDGFAGPFRVLVTRSVPKGERDVDDVQWSSIRILDFQPPWYKDGHTLVSMRIRATGALSGQLDEFNCVASRLVATPDNGWSLGRSDLVESSSPFLNAAHMLRTSPAARRITDDRIDLDAFAAKHAVLEARQEEWQQRPFNFVFDTRRSLKEAIDDCLRVARARLVLPDGRYSVVTDWDTSADPAVQVLSARAMRNVSRSVEFVDLPHAIRVRYFDRDLDWAEDELIVYRDGYDINNAETFERLETKGVVTRAQAWLLGAEALKEGELRRETVTGVHAIAHMVYQVGDVVAFRHRSISRSHGAGRVLAVDQTAGTIRIDTPVDMVAGESYRVRWATVRGSPATLDISPAEDIATDTSRPQTVTVTSSVDWWPEVGDTIVWGLATLDERRMKVRGIRPISDLSARIELIPEANEINAYVGQTPPSLDSRRQRGNRNWPPPVRNLQVAWVFYTETRQEWVPRPVTDDAFLPSEDDQYGWKTVAEPKVGYQLSWQPPAAIENADSDGGGRAREDDSADYLYSVYVQSWDAGQRLGRPLNAEEPLTEQYTRLVNRQPETSAFLEGFAAGSELRIWVTTLGTFGETPLDFAASFTTTVIGADGVAASEFLTMDTTNLSMDSVTWTWDSSPPGFNALVPAWE